LFKGALPEYGDVENKMNDWAAGLETRNYGINSRINTGILFDLLRTMIITSLIAGALLFFSWVRSQIINTGYESQKLSALEESLQRSQKQLKLEEAILRNPEHIDFLARTELNMAPLQPNQIILTSFRNEVGSNVMAMANSNAANAEKTMQVRASGMNQSN
jgi:cell division protein FtsL